MNPIRWLAIRLGAQKWLPKFAPFIVGLDRGLRAISSGHFTLLTLTGLPELFLTVRGRKSGQPRTTPLLCTPDGGGWIVVGSNWGAAKPPVWVANLRAVSAESGTAVVEYKARSYTVRATELAGQQRADAWTAALKVWPNYNVYAARTDRELSVWRLQP